MPPIPHSFFSQVRQGTLAGALCSRWSIRVIACAAWPDVLNFCGRRSPHQQRSWRVTCWTAVASTPHFKGSGWPITWCTRWVRPGPLRRMTARRRVTSAQRRRQRAARPGLAVRSDPGSTRAAGPRAGLLIHPGPPTSARTLPSAPDDQDSPAGRRPFTDRDPVRHDNGSGPRQSLIESRPRCTISGSAGPTTAGSLSS